MDKLKRIYSQKDIFISILLASISAFEVLRIYFKIKEGDTRLIRMRGDSIPIPIHLQRRMKEFLFTRVSFSGKYDHKNEVYISNRPFKSEEIVLPPYKPDQPGGTLVITPFHCTELNDTILVNRGWVPKQLKDPGTRELGQEKGELALIGIVRPSHRPLFKTRSQLPKPNEWAYEDIEAMSRVLNTAPILIDCVYESSNPGGPIGGQTDVKVPLNWVDISFLMAAFGIVAYGAVYFKMGFLARFRNWVAFRYQSRRLVAKDCR